MYLCSIYISSPAITFFTLSIILSLSKKHCPVYFSKHNVSETGFYFGLRVKPTQLGQIDRASPYFRTPVPTARWGVRNQAQHKPSATAKKILILNSAHMRLRTRELS
jgi:hypothetical protein